MGMTNTEMSSPDANLPSIFSQNPSLKIGHICNLFRVNISRAKIAGFFLVQRRRKPDFQPKKCCVHIFQFIPIRNKHIFSIRLIFMNTFFNIYTVYNSILTKISITVMSICVVIVGKKLFGKPDTVLDSRIQTEYSSTQCLLTQSSPVSPDPYSDDSNWVQLLTVPIQTESSQSWFSLSPAPYIAVSNWVPVRTVLSQSEFSVVQQWFNLIPVLYSAESIWAQSRTALSQSEPSHVQRWVNLSPVPYSTESIWVQSRTALSQSEPSSVQRWVNLSPVLYSAKSSLLHCYKRILTLLFLTGIIYICYLNKKRFIKADSIGYCQ